MLSVGCGSERDLEIISKMARQTSSLIAFLNRFKNESHPLLPRDPRNNTRTLPRQGILRLHTHPYPGCSCKCLRKFYEQSMPNCTGALRRRGWFKGVQKNTRSPTFLRTSQITNNLGQFWALLANTAKIEPMKRRVVNTDRKRSTIRGKSGITDHNFQMIFFQTQIYLIASTTKIEVFFVFLVKENVKHTSKIPGRVGLTVLIISIIIIYRIIGNKSGNQRPHLWSWGWYPVRIRSDQRKRKKRRSDKVTSVEKTTGKRYILINPIDPLFCE